MGRSMRRLFFLLAVAGAMMAPSGPASAQGFLDLLFGGGGGFEGYNENYNNSDGVLYPDEVPRSRMVPFEFRRQTVAYQTKERPGTIIVDTRNHFLYYVLGDGRALRYGVGVGRTGFGWKGTVNVGWKAEWPGWTPPPAMIAR